MNLDQEVSLTKSFNEQLINLDLQLFKRITSQSSDNDKQTLLACQLALRSLLSDYVYLEIGSYLGGSIQPFLLDERCERIYSIDKRPQVQPDERGTNYVYQSNSTERMLANLRKVSEKDLKKIVCLDGDASEIEVQKINPRPDICFIDGEHTDDAAWNDFQFCLKVLKPNGAILFHDAAVIYNGLQKIIGFLESEQTKFRAYNLPDVMFVIEIGDFPLHQEPHINRMLLDNHVGYLASLQSNDFYRQFVNKPIIRHYRQFRSWLSSSNVSE